MTVRQARGRDVASALRDARRVGHVLTPELVAELDAHVAGAFAMTQERVGVESGALRASDRSGSDVRDEGDTYVGFLAYGDDTAPVNYALYHLATNEPWFEGIPASEAAMEATITAHLRAHVR